MPKRKRRKGISVASKRKKDLPTVIQGEDDEGYLEDVEDMADEGWMAGELTTGGNFLTKLNIDKLLSDSHKKKKKKKDGEEPSAPHDRDDDLSSADDVQDISSDEEALYERLPRSSSWKDPAEGSSDTHYLLPLKTGHGKLIQQQTTLLAAEESSEKETPPSSSADESGDHSDAIEKLTPAQLLAQNQKKQMKKKEEVAAIVSQLKENPEGNIGQLKQLRALCNEKDPDVAVMTRIIAMESFLDVMKDITPSYHIRELTEVEKAVKVSRDVRKLRVFEQTLILDYQQFLSLCNEYIKAGISGPAARNGEKKSRRERKKSVLLLDSDQVLSSSTVEVLAEASVKCFCDLLISLPHFNFSTNIIASLIPLLPSKAFQGRISALCCDTIGSLFRNDATGEISLEAVRHIAKFVTVKGYKTKPAVLRTFLELRLCNMESPVAVAGTAGKGSGIKRGSRQKISKKQKLRRISEAKLESDLQEASAIASKKKQGEVQTEILKVVFLTYLKILKHSRHSPLLQPALEGLAKFSRLINVDFFADLMSLLHSLAESGGLYVVATAFQILSQQGIGSTLRVDPKYFYVQLYSALLRLDTFSDSKDVELVVKTLGNVVRNRRDALTERILGFVKRLGTMSLHVQGHAALALLATIRKFMESYTQCEELLEVDTMSGVYKPEILDPDMSCSSSTSLWELADLRLHYDPTVASYAKFLLYGAPQEKHALPPNLAKKNPMDFAKRTELLEF